jgi:hypothetical protein
VPAFKNYLKVSLKLKELRGGIKTLIFKALKT